MAANKVGMEVNDEQVAHLAEMARCGDRVAVEKLVELLRGNLFRLVYYRTRSRLDSDDLTQEIVLTMLRELHTLKDARRFRPWLYRMAINRIHDYHRKKRVLVLLGMGSKSEEELEQQETADSNPQALNHLLRREFWERLRKFAGGLSRWEREVFFLRFLDQLTIKEIAEALKKSESAVKTHLYRAVNKFKNDLEMIHLMEGIPL
jgi:RNA polymerase sigma-70 factor (ECF subfamily)